MKRNLLIGAVVLLLVIGALYGNIGNKEAPVVERPEAGFRAPSFDLEGLDGKHYSLSDLNKPVVINFWASWCGPCKLEAPILTNLYEKYGKDVEFYAINLTSNDQLPKAQQFVDQYQFTFPVLLDSDGRVSKQYQVIAIPSTFYVDRHQTVLKAAPGLHSEEQMAQWIEQLIQIP